MTADEFVALPEEKPYLEYVDGVVLQKPMPNADHGELAAEIAYHLRAWSGGHPSHIRVEARAKVGDLPNYRLPDISYWAPGVPAQDDSLPTLAIEIRSPNQTLGELREKARFFRRNGVDVCWVIDPQARSAEWFEGPTDGAVLGEDGVLRSHHLPGFELPLRTLFAALPQ